jgi:hypothetical protein
MIQGRLEHGQDESVGHAISRVAEASQRFVSDKLDLMKVEAKAAIDEKVTAASEAGKSIAILAAAGFIIFMSWITLMAAAVVALSKVIGAAGGLAVVGGAHLVAGLALIALSRRKATTAGKAAKGELRAEQRLSSHVAVAR